MHRAAHCPPPPPKEKKAPDGRWLPGAVRSVTAHAPARLHSYRALPGSSSPAAPGRPGVGQLHRIHESPGRLVPPEQLFHLFQVSDPELRRAAPRRAAMPAIVMRLNKMSNTFFIVMPFSRGGMLFLA